MNLRLEPWGAEDLDLLHRLHGDPAMMEHLGGAESPEKIVERHGRYLRMPEGQAMFKVLDETGERVGMVGYWERDWRGERVYETGWFVLPEFQGRGIATTAMAQAIDSARAEQRNRYMHAFPSVENPASNAISRKLGFTLLEEGMEFEFPPGNMLRCNDWRLDLEARGS
jgi:RimJ/RimL family protein N-acetyltransferase